VSVRLSNVQDKKGGIGNDPTFFAFRMPLEATISLAPCLTLDLDSDEPGPLKGERGPQLYGNIHEPKMRNSRRSPG